MTDGVISGKTGYTGNAGYCYVCACEKDGKTFIVALLGCGWPNNKTYKWKDTMKLLNYGAESFSYRTIYKDCKLPSLVVKNGVSPGKWPSEDVQTTLTLSVSGEQKSEQLLLRKDAVLKYQVELPETLEAPVAAGEEVGSVVCYANDEEVARYPVLADQAFLKLTFSWCAETVFHAYFP
jgi:D-alanyl-D-alanine carboxypeptidase (penicillin-binding protein 5/6)